MNTRLYGIAAFLIVISVNAFFGCDSLMAQEKSLGSSQQTEPATDAVSDQSLIASTMLNSIGMKLKLIPSGTFIMGSPESEKDRFNAEGPQHKVTISKPFYMGVHEVTQGQYRSVMGFTWKKPKQIKIGDDYAASYMYRDEAVEFCKRLSAREGKTYRLPTEAQWEYACRAGSTTKFHFGDSEDLLSEYAWWGGIFGEGNAKEERYPHRVGQLKPNAFGLFDMHGNVFEWCRNRKRPYSADDKLDPVGPKTGGGYVYRGGSWGSSPVKLRSAFRENEYLPAIISISIGFRVVCEVE